MLLTPVRYMTIHEAKLIQSFPADFRIVGSWGEALRQIGNAVPVKLAQTVGAHLRKLLETEPCRHGSLYERGEVNGTSIYPTTLKGEQMMLAMEKPPSRKYAAKHPRRAARRAGLAN